MQLLKHFHELSLHPNNAKELKALILQLAVQGKLTEQWRLENTNLESGQKLLQRIKHEKVVAVKNVRIKKEKSLKKVIEENDSFNVPDSWVWCKLNDISLINGGFAFKSSQYVDEGVRVIRISDFDENGLKGGKIVRYKYSHDLKPYELEVKNILMAMTGGTVGKSYFVESLEERMVVNQRVAAIKLIQPINEAYINCVIPTKLVQGVIEAAKNSTNDNISMSDIKNFNIPLPPLEEQKAIVKVVEQLFKEVEQLEQLTEKRIQLKEQFATSALRDLTTNNTVKEWEVLQPHFYTFFNEALNIKKLRESILQLAVQGILTAHWRSLHSPFEGGTGDVIDHDARCLLDRIKAEKVKLVKDKKIKKEKLLPLITEDEIPYTLPEGWVWCRFNETCEKITQGPNPKYNALTTKKYKVLKTKDFYDTVIHYDRCTDISMADFKEWERFELKTNDIIFGLVGKGSTGKCNIFIEQPDSRYIFTRATGLFRLLPNSNILSDYVKVYFTSMIGKSQIDNITDGSTGQLVIKTSEIKQLPFSIPPFKEQKAIIESVNRLMALCDALEQQVKLSKEQSERWMKGSLREVLQH